MTEQNTGVNDIMVSRIPGLGEAKTRKHQRKREEDWKSPGATLTALHNKQQAETQKWLGVFCWAQGVVERALRPGAKIVASAKTTSEN